MRQSLDRFRIVPDVSVKSMVDVTDTELLPFIPELQHSQSLQSKQCHHSVSTYHLFMLKD